MYDIIVIGSSTRDVFLKSEGHKVIKDRDFATGQGQCFPLGSKIQVKKLAFTIGGGGANAAVTFARQGLSAACVGVIGNDFNGKELLDTLSAEGVDVSHFQKHDDDYTAYSVILVDDSGERTILSYKGEGQHFDVAKIPFERFQTKWMYLDSLGGHYDILEKAVLWAAENNVKLATNPGGGELAHGLEKLRPLLKHFSIVLMNQEEAARLTGIPYDQEEKLFKAMDDLIGGIFVMTKGSVGSVVSDGKRIYHAGIPDSPVVERTGAGDAFNAGFTAQYIVSGDIVKAIQFATANATSVVGQYGGVAGVLKKDQWGEWPLVEVSE